MGNLNSSTVSNTLANEVSGMCKNLDTQETLIILQLWKKTALKNKNKSKKDKLSLSSEVSKDEFVSLFTEVAVTEQFTEKYPVLNKAGAIELLFQVFDSNNNGYISLEEFVTGLATLSSSSFADKAELIFRSYDLNGNGSLSKEEVTKSLRKGVRGSTKALLADSLTNTEDYMKLVAKMDEKAIQNTVEHLFATCDPGNTGDITLVQWQGKCESDPILRHLLQAMMVSEANNVGARLPIHPSMFSN